MNEEERRKNDEEGRGGWVLYCNLPTDLPMEIRIIFSWAVALIFISNFCRYFLYLALKF